MSSNDSKNFGTQSPPLEATDSAKPMGVSSIGGQPPDYVPDAQQRERYFEGVETRKENPEQVGTGVNEKEKIKTD